MSKQQKIINRLLNLNGVFTWPELCTLLKGLGYRQIEGDGSRVKFDNGNVRAMITLHKPHPGNQIKSYIRKAVIERLKTEGMI